MKQGKKQIVKLTESQLKGIIAENVKKVLEEAYGIDYNDTLQWVQKKFPDKSYEEQTRFAQNIINKNKYTKELISDALGAMSVFDMEFDEWYWSVKNTNSKIDKNFALDIWKKAEIEYRKRVNKRGYEDSNDFLDAFNENENIKQSKKQIVRLTESQLRGMIAESVRKVLKENEGYQNFMNNYLYDSDNQREQVQNLRQGKYADLERYRDYNDWYNSEQGWKCYDEWVEMSDKLPGGGEQLDKLISNNPIFKRWYEALHKRYENEYSWELYERYKNEVLFYIKQEKENALNNDSWYRNDEFYNLSNDNYFDYNGRNPKTEKLHTKDSANRDLMSIDKQRKSKK